MARLYTTSTPKIIHSKSFASTDSLVFFPQGCMKSEKLRTMIISSSVNGVRTSLIGKSNPPANLLLGRRKHRSRLSASLQKRASIRTGNTEVSKML